jgi:UDP-3-O-[3-hydroxymyristoyl] glucosamine N-acyltransferase
VQHDLEAGAVVMGYPARPKVEWARNLAAFDHLAEMRKELRALRRRVAELEGAGHGPGEE